MMKYYIDPTVGIRAFESDGSQDFLITDAMRPLTAEELEAHLNPTPTARQLQGQANAAARQYLLDTDWYVIRMQETGAPVPDEVLQARQAARDAIVTLLD